ncbi:transposase [Nitrosomonas communis]|uniref:transposase n=1 Tax=Nitrosomonas communis TaxID=44574 RepID=UPI003CC7ACFA
MSDGAWRYLKPYLPVSAVWRPRELSMRQVVNAILYVLKTGCQWRQLPREFPAWSSVYYISTAGPITGHGNIFIICYALACEKNAADINSRRQAA